MTYYRYQEILYTDSKLMLSLRTFDVIKETKHGVWIDNFGAKRFVLRGSRKCFAHPTKEEAFKSFIKRKERQARILRHQLNRAEAALRLTTEENIVWLGFDS